MDSPPFLQFRRTSTTVNAVSFADIDDDDKFFDLVIHSKNDFEFMDSPRDVFISSKPNSTHKLKVFVLGFRKSSKSMKSEPNSSPMSNYSDNSLRSQMLKDNSADFAVVATKSIPISLKLIKPFYMKATKKPKVASSETPFSSPSPVRFSPRKVSEGSRIGSFKVVARRLVKSRSTSAAVGIPPLPPPQRRDDTLLEQQDGIRNAILHCKKSYSSSSSYEFCRSASDASEDSLGMRGRNSCEEQKRFSI